MGRRLRSRNAKSTAFVASGIVLKSYVVQLKKAILVIVWCGHGTTVESSMVFVELGVCQGDALFSAGDGEGFFVPMCSGGTCYTHLRGIDQCEIVCGIEWIAWDG